MVEKAEAISRQWRRKKHRGHQLTGEMLSGVTGVADFLVIVVVGIGVYFAYLGLEHQQFSKYLALSILGAILCVVGFFIVELYNRILIARMGGVLVRTIIVTSVAILFVVALLFALKASDQVSRVWMVLWGSLCPFLVWGYRKALQRVLFRRAVYEKLASRVVVIGGGEQGQRLLRYFAEHSDPWVKVLGVFDDRKTRIPEQLSGIPVLGDLDAAIAYVRNNQVDDVIVCLPLFAEHRILEVLQSLRALPVHVSLGPDLAALHLVSSRWRHFADLPVLEISRQPISGWQYAAKRTVDFILSLIGLLLISPLLILIGLLIKLDSPGPIFFRQNRLGFNNEVIKVLKFRTMRADATDQNASRLTTRNDPRVTRIGHFLRRTSLDELPQLINVLSGEMSLVGPRPHAMEAKAGHDLYHDVTKRYAERHKVKPGITGWAQVNGWRGNTDTREKLLKRVEFDLQYIDRWSLWLDFRILLKTLAVCFKGENAY